MPFGWKTNLRNWLILGRIQSFPLTVLPLLLGYLTVTNSVIYGEIIALIVVGSVGHWSVYSHNDYVDRHNDRLAGKTDKPLVNGAIEVGAADRVIFAGIILSIALGFILLDFSSFILWMFALVLGIYYNYVCKIALYSPLVLLLWGIDIVMVGAYHAGDPNLTTFILSFIVGIHIFIATVYEGDIKDLGEGENNIAEIGVELYNGQDGQLRKRSEWWYQDSFYGFNIIQFGLALYIALESVYLILTLIFATFALIVGNELVRDSKFDKEDIKENIVFYTIHSIVAISVSFAAVISIDYILVLLVFAIIWGISWQRILYGSTVYFP